jgi:putative oxidoreductase
MNLDFPILFHLGCILIGFYFAFFGVWNSYHWKPTLAVMMQKKIPYAKFLLGLGILIQTITGLMILLDLYSNIAALILIPFNLSAVFMFHPFWTFEGEIRRLNMIVFIANLTATMSSLLFLIAI